MKRTLILILFVMLSSFAGCQLFHRHEFIHHDEVKATCTLDGHSAYDSCADPDCDYVTEYIIYPATGHSLINYWRKEATREAPGHTTYSACENCSYTNGYKELSYVYSLEELLPPFEERPYINCLSKQEQTHMKGLYDAVMSFQKTYYFSGGISYEQLDNYMYLLNTSFPEVMQISAYDNYYYFGDYVYSITFKYIMDEEEYLSAADTVAREVLSIVSQTEGMSEYETERFLHDYMIDWCSYDKETTHASSPYGFFVEKKAKCDGYARTFMLLLSAAGMKCHSVVGNTDGEGHAWNIVNIDGVYCYVDVTWDDTGNPSMPYQYFNLDFASMQRSGHELLDFYAKMVPECNSLQFRLTCKNRITGTVSDSAVQYRSDFYNNPKQKSKSNSLYRVF